MMWRRELHEGLFGAAMLLAQFACVLMLLGSLGYFGWLAARGTGAFVPYLDVGLRDAPLLALSVHLLLVRKAMKHGALSFLSYAALFAVSVAAMHASAEWFAWQMHDIELLFGRHGRWGCETINADGSPAHFLRAGTMPALLFGPLFAGILVHAILSRTQRTPGGSDSIVSGASDAGPSG